MGRYLFQGSYSLDGIKGVLKEGGTGRRKAVEDAVKALGGKVEAYYFGFGDTDVYVIVDGVDNETAAAFSLGIAATGAVHGVKTTVLLTPEEIDAATKKTLSYRAPGR
ncbi:MAG TPA: GYD domain-containing protein [Candidatus Dormibacteraeota bacterium]|nr:GYD domain-containing protein [Candidatus Dormibacteraeota bacterium]